MKSVKTILGESDRQDEELFYNLDDRGYPILDTNGNKTYEPSVYHFEWDKHNKTFTLSFYEDQIGIIVECHEKSDLYLKGKEILAIDHCNVAQVLLTASDFWYDRIEIPMNTDPNSSVVIRTKTGDQYEGEKHEVDSHT